jgi:ABC-2 type transport system ATP-binding protein
VIELEALTKAYGKTVAVQNVTETIGRGEIVALVGPNGAGKSTTLGIATGQVVPDAGRVRLGGHDLVTAPLDARRALGYLPQEPLLPRYLTATELLAFVADVRGVPKGGNDALLALALEGPDRDRLIAELSVGTQQKVAFAAALVGAPVAIVLDEPFTGLDVRAVRRFEEEVRRRAAAGAAVLLSSHDFEGIERLATRAVALRAGCVSARLGPGEVTEPALAALLGD